jgi:Tol biopolymer transport system component
LRIPEKSSPEIVTIKADDRQGKRTAPALPPPPASSRLLWTLVAVAAIAITAVGTVVFLTLTSAPDSSAISRPRNSEQIWQLTRSGGLDREPTWSPDGRLVAFSSNRSGNLDIWVQSIGGGNAVQITSSPADDRQPDWSSDGRIVFRSEREGGGLYVVPALGGAEQQVATFGDHPRWSPDGTRILFQRSNVQGQEPTSKELYVVAQDGSEPSQVLAAAIADFTSFAAAWHPDSSRVSVWGVRLDGSTSFLTAPVGGGSAITSAMSDEVRSQVFSENVRFTDSSNVPLPFVWDPAGDALYLEGNARGVPGLWRIPADAATLRWSGPPVRMTTSADLNPGLSLSRDGRKLAFAQASGQIWILDGLKR